MSDTTVFPCIFGLMGQTFEHVYSTKKEWVDFTANEMTNTSGIFEVWQNYVLMKIKKENNGNRFIKTNK